MLLHPRFQRLPVAVQIVYQPVQPRVTPGIRRPGGRQGKGIPAGGAGGGQFLPERLEHFIIRCHRRGLLKPGYAADITVFDPETIAPRATYMAPVQLAAGVRHVVVGGRTALKDGAQTDVRAGRFLRKNREN